MSAVGARQYKEEEEVAENMPLADASARSSRTARPCPRPRVSDPGSTIDKVHLFSSSVACELGW